MSDAVRAHVFVSGLVQGVFFRAFTARRASDAGVAGWVRNVPDGRVEAVLEGTRDSVEDVLRWCREGPPHARVSDVDVTWESPRGESDFSVR